MATSAGDPSGGVSGWVIAWCVENRLFVLVMAAVVAGVGGWAVATTPVDAIPDLSDVQVIVSAEWKGRDSQTVEDQVTYPITQKLLSVPGVDDVRGFSFFGLSFTYVIFDEGTDLYWARSRVLEKMSEVQGAMPEGVTPSLGPDASGLGWVFLYTLEGGFYCPEHPEVEAEHAGTCPRGGRSLVRADVDLGQLRALQDWYVRYQLESVPGVAEVASVGGHVRQYQVRLDPRKLLAFDLSTGRVVEALREGNDDVGGRVLEQAETEFMVRGRGYLEGVDDIEQTVVAARGPDGTPVLIEDLGEVALAPDLRRGVAEKNGEGEVVAGIVVMRLGENALDVIDASKAKLREISAGLPDGVVVRRAYDRSDLIHRSINTLSWQLGEEMLIVAVVCVVFLWHARSALVSAITLPLGVLVSFIVMRWLGIPANIMSLGGIAIAIGAMVDAAVVMVENTHKHLDGRSGVTGAERWALVTRACQEVGPALFFSLLVITVSFLPVFALEDQAGRLFKPLAYTKTFAMAAAALIALLVMPPLIGLVVRGEIKSEERNPISRVLVALYLPVLRFALRRRKLTMAASVVVLAVTFVPLRGLGSEFMPPLREGDILYMPTSVPGLSGAEARRTLQIQDRLLARFPEVRVVLGKIGRATTPTDPAPLNMVETHVSLRPRDEWPARKLPQGYVQNLTADLLEELIAGGDVRARRPPEVAPDGGLRRLVRRELSGLAEAGLLAPGDPAAQPDVESQAREVAAALRSDLDDAVRRAWLERSTLEAARAALPEPAELKRLLSEQLAAEAEADEALSASQAAAQRAHLEAEAAPTRRYAAALRRLELRRPSYDVDRLADQVEGMVRAEVTDWARAELSGGEPLESVRSRVPERLRGEVQDALPGLLLSEHAVDATGLSELRERLGELLERAVPDDIELVPTTFTELTKEEMERTIHIPGMPNWWLQPIETRIGMLTTGMRGLLGVKIRGESLEEIDRLAVQVEEVLGGVEGTQTVAADRVRGGRYLDLDIRRDALARHGLTVEDVQDVIETAIGGAPVTHTVEGRYRFPVQVRYPREMRDDPAKLGRVLVTTPDGAHVPLRQLADIRTANGPPAIKSENGLLLANVPVDLEPGLDIGTYVARAEEALAAAQEEGRLELAPGTYYEWSGQYELMQEVRQRLQLIVPVTLVIIFLILYLNMRDMGETLITILSLPFALTGGLWLMFFLGYDLSVAVAVGFIAVAGLAAETAVIMHVYLDLAYRQRLGPGEEALAPEALTGAVIEGAVLRVRPKMMTVATTVLGLLPILWATGAGAGPMKRMAAPMIGGLLTSTVTTLVLIPVCYAIYKGWRARSSPSG